MTEATLRPAVPEDADQLGRLAYQLVKLHHDWDRERFIAISDPNAPRYGSWLGSGAKGDPAAVVLVATLPDGDRDAICGYTYARMEGKDWNDLRDACGMLHDIFVDPKVRRRGIARRLALATFAALEQKGAPFIVLKTAAMNAAAQAFFASIGFRPTMIEMTRSRSDGEA